MNYAVLGDDVVITDPPTSHVYSQTLEKLGVTISPGKSLYSRSGSMEVAKRFWVKSMKVDLSPIAQLLL